MIEVFRPIDDGELAIAKSILDSENINYYVKNDHFGSLYAGAAISFFNQKIIYVAENESGKAFDLLSNLINNKKTGQ